MSSQEAKRLKELEKENARLKKLVAEQAHLTEDGRRLKMMPVVVVVVVDEYTRECLSIEVERRLSGG